MNIMYEIDPTALEISEKENDNDKEFNIKLYDKSLVNKIHKVRDFFEDDKIYTDVFFYTHTDHTYQVIVKNEYYTDFIIELFKEKLLQKISWQ